MANSKSTVKKAPRSKRASATVLSVPDTNATKSLDSRNLELNEANELLRNSLRRGKTDPGNRRHWGLPARGGYQGGNITGRAAARIYLKFLRNHTAGYTGAGSLQSIMLDMLSGKRKSDSLAGQVVGFLCEIDHILEEVSGQLRFLDDVTFESLAKEIDQGLARTKADDQAERTAWRSTAAREAWERRRAKAVSACGAGATKKSCAAPRLRHPAQLDKLAADSSKYYWP
jgi:hypothetical protein